MKIFTLEYQEYKLKNRINLGDEIQTIAATKLLPKVDGKVSREGLNKIETPCIVSLNGFFMDSNNWPPSEAVVPIPFSFHISKKYESNICSFEGLSYLKQYEPIGCRDSYTVTILKKHNIDAYYSKCVTLTLEKRSAPPKDGKAFIVGVTESVQRVIPANILKDAVYVNQHKIQLPSISTKLKSSLAEELLDTYKKEASLVITSRIHCAMPCIAMGIPVIFLNSLSKKSDYRVHIIEDLIGINYIDERLLFLKPIQNYYAKKINWNPVAKDIEEEKITIKNGFEKALTKAISNYNIRFSN